MIFHQLKPAVLAVTLLAGAGLLATAAPAPSREGEPPGEPIVKEARQEPRPPNTPRPADAPPRAPTGRMTVTGRVLGPDGRPAAGVPVDIIAAARKPELDADVEREPFVVLGQGTTDADGRFRIEAARASSARFEDVHALAGAAGPGSACGCVSLAADAEQPSAEIHLQSEQVVRGKLVDVNGQPPAGVAVQLDSAYGLSRPGARFDSPNFGSTAVLSVLPERLRAWPKAVTTDPQGRFTFTGIGRGFSLWLSVHDPRFAQQRFIFGAEDRDAGKEVSLALHPATIIEGRVLAADTGRPIPDAVVAVQGGTGVFGARFTTRSRADGQGRFRVNPSAGDYFRLRAIPPRGQAYLPGEAEFEWAKGAVKKEIDLKVPRGVLIHGKVTEQGTGRPVPGASVRSFAMRQPGGMIEGDVVAGDDGSYRFAVPPGKGHLLVLAPTLDYVPQEIGGGTLYASGRRGSLRFYAHAIIAYEVGAGEASHRLDATLEPGKTLRGRVLGPAGETVEDAVILTRQQIDPTNLVWQGHNPIHARDGRFELSGFHLEKAAPAYFLDAEHQWGAAVELSGRQAGEDVTVRLQPCGRARARFVGPDGRPVAKLRIIPYVYLLMTPGSTHHIYLDGGDTLAADEAFLPNVDRKHYPSDLATDADGRIILPALIPGAPYRISDWSTRNIQEKGIQLRKDFTIKPGETVDLGDILVEKLRDD
jgi:protocatechuate 3,4-dioxygenase beta subunit